MKRILILTSRSLHNGPRIIREIEALKNDFEIVAVGKTSTPFEVVEFEYYDLPAIYERALHRVYRMFNKGKEWPGRFYSINKKLSGLFKKYEPGIVITHEPEFLPYIDRYKSKYNFKVVFNAHEYCPLQFDTRPNWKNTGGKFYFNLYENYLKKIDLLVNVCDGIAIKCKEEFGKDSIVIPNVSIYYPAIRPVFHDEKEKLIKIIHHGGAIRERKIEYMIEAVQKLGNSFRLDLMLVPGSQDYINELKIMAQKAGNVNLIPSVSFYDIVPSLNKYDIGLYNIPGNGFNQLNSLPNKLFEFIQARLCIVISNSPEMKKIVEQYDLGFVSEGCSAEELYNCLKNISIQQINNCKRNANDAAEKLSAEKYYQFYIDAIKAL